MVGNNTPIFFVRDPMKFQHFIRSQKRRADNGLRDHDMQWDFWTLSRKTALCGSRTSAIRCTPNSKGGPNADGERYPEVATWGASGEFIRAAYSKRRDDDDFGQAGTMVRQVLNDDARDRLISNVIGHLKKGVTEPVLERAFSYWRSIDEAIGNRIANGVKG